MLTRISFFFFFFFNDTATTEIYTLSLHDALPIFFNQFQQHPVGTEATGPRHCTYLGCDIFGQAHALSHSRSEEHTSELQSPCNLVCRLLLEKKKNTISRLDRSMTHSLQSYANYRT